MGRRKQHKYRVLFLLLICSSNVVLAQVNPTTGKNYIIKRTPRVGVSNEKDLLDSVAAKQGAIIEYYDGLGRPLQTIQAATIPVGNQYNDLIVPHVYDCMGREYRQYLPLPKVQGVNSGGYVSGSILEQANYYKSQPSYGETVFDGTPLSRVVEQSSPGKLWNLGAGHTVTTIFDSNGEKEVIYWTQNKGTGKLDSLGFYDEGTLRRTKVKSEDGTLTVEYKNLEGKIVRKIEDAEKVHFVTDYVYDTYGRLSWVLPPKLMTRFCGKLFFNGLLNVAFEKRGCPVDEKGSRVMYTVAANKYNSKLSYSDAMIMAKNEALTNGQAKADMEGFCCYLKSSSNAMLLSAPRGTITLPIKTNTKWTVKCYEPWITISPTSDR